jgi:uncharacterized OB-fold protein
METAVMNEFDTPLIPRANARLSPDYVQPYGAGIALSGQHCDDCGKTLFPKTGVCPACRSEKVSDILLPTQGVLYSWSVVHVAPKPWVTPYVIGYVDLPNGVRVFSHIAGNAERLTVGMPVKLEAAAVPADDQSVAAPLFKFAPLEKENA